MHLIGASGVSPFRRFIARFLSSGGTAVAASEEQAAAPALIEIVSEENQTEQNQTEVGTHVHSCCIPKPKQLVMGPAEPTEAMITQEIARLAASRQGRPRSCYNPRRLLGRRKYFRTKAGYVWMIS